MAEQVAHAREALMAQGPVEISAGLIGGEDNVLTTAFAAYVSVAFACSRYRSVGLELDITPDGTTSIEVIVEVSNDGQATWSPAYYQTAITSSLRTVKPDITQILVADLDPAGDTPANNRVKLPPIDVRDVHWLRVKIKKTGTGDPEVQVYATGGQGA